MRDESRDREKKHMRTDESVERPLHGLRVIEFEGIGPGPLAGRMLSDLGAHVIVVARPTTSAIDRTLIGNNTENPMRQGKEIIVLDLKTANGVVAALDLVADADALIEGNRPGVMERLGLGPVECAIRNPRLVYGRMTGWGQSGHSLPIVFVQISDPVRSKDLFSSDLVSAVAAPFEVILATAS